MPFSGKCNDCKEQGIYQICIVVVTSYLALRRNMSQELAGCFWAPIKEGNLIEQEITACL
jgi:hypothetical protein